MLLIVHILIEEIQDIHCHTIGFAGRAVGIKVDSILVLSSGLLEYKDSFYLETTNKYSVKNKKNGEIKSPKLNEILSECHNFGLV